MNKRSTLNHQVPSLKPLLAMLLAGFSPLMVQAAGPVIPGAGSLLQQVQPVVPPSPSSSETRLTIEGDNVANLPQSAPFLVKTVQIVGNTRFDTATLHALVAEAEGSTMTLAGLGELAARITAYYRSQDYPLARAIIPAQAMQGGVVKIEVIEARYGKILLNNRSDVRDPLLEATISSLQPGQVISQMEMDHTLLLLSDIPGVVFNATLKAGEAVGTSDLLLSSASTPAVVGNVTVDGYGDRFTGRERISGTVNVINLLHSADVLSVSVLTSGSGLNYGRLGYETLLNGQGTRVGASYSALRYHLGGPLDALDANGRAQVASLWVRHPLLRSRDVNVHGQFQYDHLQLRDHVNVSARRTDRHLDLWTASLNGDVRDAMLSGGITSWNLGMAVGQVGFDDSAAQSYDAATAGTRGGFTKWNANLARLQRLSQKNTLHLAFSGQWADGNLDSSQKMSAGGPYAVRAYDTGAVSGDTGYLGTVELRHDVDIAWSGQWQAVAFIDSARVRVNENTWFGTSGSNSVNLSGAGVGLNWTGPAHWSAKAMLATRIGSTPLLAANTSSVRAWLGVSKGF
jgi:hemolysin activation/secretion protein